MHGIGVAALSLTILAANTIVVPAYGATSPCVELSRRGGTCDPPTWDGSLDDGGVDLRGDEWWRSGNQGGRTGPSDDQPYDPRELPYRPAPCRLDVPLDKCVVNPRESEPSRHDRLLSDLQRFQPEPSAISNQPRGWGIVGRPTNFMTNATTHMQSGSLLGAQADVRFVPVESRWDFGDGTTHTTNSLGRSWQDQNLPELSPTATSHVFANPGQYRVTGEVTYTTEFRIDGGRWQSMPGTLTGQMSELTIVVTHGDTALINNLRDAQILTNDDS